MDKDLNAEACVLSGVLNQPSFILEVIDTLSEEKFYHKPHKVIFRTMLSLFEDNIDIDIITLIDRLRDNKTLKGVGGINYLNDISDVVISASNGKSWIKIVNEKYILRNIKLKAKEAISLCTSGDEINSILSKVQESFLDIGVITKKPFKKLIDVAETFMSDKEDIMSGKKVRSKLYTGLRYLDEKVDIEKGRLVIIGAKRSVGKTVMGNTIAFLNCLTRNYKAGIFTQEMRATDTLAREIPRSGTITLDQVNHLSYADIGKVQKVLENIQDCNVLIDDSSNQSLSNIRSKALKMKYSMKGLDLIVVDYLQIMKTTSGDNREQQIASLSRGLKAIANDLDVAVVALTQLNADGKARESRAIEQDADVFIKIRRPMFENDSQPLNFIIGNKEVEVTSNLYSVIIISKNRFGETGLSEAWFEGEYQRFVDYENQLDNI